jgi:nicotinate-nucleotide pyrophosphorylase (carboxylating)
MSNPKNKSLPANGRNSGYHDHPSLWNPWIEQALTDDDWLWDWTTEATLRSALHKKGDGQARARVVAKQSGIWAGEGLLEAIERVSAGKGLPIEITRVSRDLRNGAEIREGQELLQWSGPLRAILTFERGFLNLAQYACGIATRTNRMVRAVRHGWKAQGLPTESMPRVTSTRKTLPGYRDIAVVSVLAGGGMSHRTSLAGGVLIKENHIALCGGIGEAIEAARAVAPHGLKVEVEVRSHEELCEALSAHAEVVMLDNFSPEQARSSVEWVRKSAPGTIVELSGGLNEANVASYLCEGIHILSSGALTHSVQALDLSMLIEGVR